MEKVNVKKIMEMEKSLLEIYTNHKFDLSIGDYMKLIKLLREIGEITNVYFELQQEFHETFNDKDKLMEYHNRLKNDEIECDVNGIETFINKLNFK